MTHVHPTRDDAVVAGLSEVVGGPMGERALPHRWWTPTRVLLLLTAVVFAAGLVQKAPCSLAQGRDQNWVYSHMCYTDLRPLYVPRGMVEHAWPYSDDSATRARYDVMEYPVGISYWAWGTAWITHWLNGSPDVGERQQSPVSDLHGDPEVRSEQTIFVLVNAVGFAALALLAVWLLSRTHRLRPWDAAAFALSPALLLTGLINWDLIAVALVAGALWAWSRDRPVLTGVLIGLGTAAKLYPLFLLGAILVICLRRGSLRESVGITGGSSGVPHPGHAPRGVADAHETNPVSLRAGALRGTHPEHGPPSTNLRRHPLGRFALTALSAAAAWVAANAPAYLTGPDQWQVFWSFNSARGPDLGSLWMLVNQAADANISAHTVNVWSWGLFGAWCVGVFVIGMTAGRRVSIPRLAQLGYLIVVGFLIVNKVYSPQYVLWLLPLAVLARPRWRDQLVWQAGEVFYFCTVWWYLGGYLAPAGGGDAGFYWIGIVVRVLAELYLAAVIVRDMYRPEHDPVRDQPETTIRSNVVAV